MKIKQYKSISFAIIAASLYAISSPVSKLLLKEIPPTLMASFIGKHNHIYAHEEYTHSHKHTQDIHHSHAH
jgi:hypothetical protein